MNLLKLRFHLIISIPLMLFSCSNDADKGNTIETVDLLTAYEGRHSIPISEVATELEYIQLESGKDHILRDPHIIDIKDSLILYVGFRQIYVFSRNTGKFLYEISGHGRGPEEYSGTDRVYNPNSGLFYVYLKDVRDGQKNLRKYGAYNIKGELIRYMDLPESNFARDSTFLVSNFWPMNNGNFIGYVVNITGKSPYKLAEFLQNGEIVKFHSNYNMIDSKDFFEPPMYGPSFSIFYQFSDSVRFYEQYTDTVFSITPDYLLPKFHLQMGDLLMPYKFKAKSFSYWNEEMKYFYLDSFRESSRFLFFTVGIDKYRYLVYYDKKQKSTQVCSTTENLEFYKYPDYYSIRCIGFENDIDDFVPIGTHQNLFIHGRDEFISIIPAIEVKDWFDKNPSKANSLDDKLKKFKDVSAEDNPLIVIAKLRK